MTEERNGISLVKYTQLLLSPINTVKINLPQHTKNFRVRFKLPNVITFPTDAVYQVHNENNPIIDKNNIVGKLLIHPHTHLLCIVHRFLTFN